MNATTYGRPGIVRSFFRTLLLPLDVAIGWLVSMLPSATNERIGDRFAGTRVVSLSWYGVAPDATHLPGRARGAAAPRSASPSALPIPGSTVPGAGVPPPAYQPRRPPGMGPSATPTPTPPINPFSIPGPPPEQQGQPRQPQSLPRRDDFHAPGDPGPT